jgi:hypothetical protein
VTIAHESLRTMATLVTARLDGAHELHRIALVDDVLGAARRLSRVLDELTRHSVMEYRGSHSTWDLRAEADAAFLAIRAYASALDRVASVDVPSGRQASQDR